MAGETKLSHYKTIDNTAAIFDTYPIYNLTKLLPYNTFIVPAENTEAFIFGMI